MPDAHLHIHDSVVSGNVSSDSAFVVGLYSVSVGGNVQVKLSELGGGAELVDIGGNLQWEENPGGDLICNIVGGNLQAKKNDYPFISFNTIGENLECDDNVDTVGLYNVVGGDAQGQCAEGFIGESECEGSGHHDGGGTTTELPTDEADADGPE